MLVESLRGMSENLASDCHVVLGQRDISVPHVRCEDGHPILDVDARAIPLGDPVDRERVAEVVYPRTALRGLDSARAQGARGKAGKPVLSVWAAARPLKQRTLRAPRLGRKAVDERHRRRLVHHIPRSRPHCPRAARTGRRIQRRFRHV